MKALKPKIVDIELLAGFIPFIKELKQGRKNWTGYFKNGIRLTISDIILQELVQAGKA